MSRYHTDFEIEAPSGQLVAVIEVKNLEELTSTIADEFRQGVLANDGELSGAYFLLISQEIGFLWEPRSIADGEQTSGIQFTMRPVLQGYLSPDQLNQHLRGVELEIPVLQWLNDLTRGLGLIPWSSDAAPDFLRRLRGADVRAPSRL